MSPERKKSIVKQLNTEFPSTLKKLPTSTSVGGRAMELVQKNYLENPRKGGKTHDVFDPNSLDQSFPALDIFATPSDKLSPMVIVQSKGHLQSDVGKRVSAYTRDLKQVNDKSQKLSKRVHPEDDKIYLKYGKPLMKGLKKAGASETDLDMFRRADSTKNYDDYLDDVHNKRETLSSNVQNRIVYPVSPKTYSFLDDPRVVSLPVHTEDIQALVDNIPNREIVARNRKGSQTKDEDYKEESVNKKKRKFQKSESDEDLEKPVKKRKYDLRKRK